MNEVTDQPTNSDCQGPALTIDCLDQKFASIPEPLRVFRGIKEESIGCFFGPSKSGKTTLVENLMFSLAAGKDTFLGDPIQSSKRKGLLINLEEFPRSRNSRNKRQVEAISREQNGNTDWIHNVLVIDDTFPRYLTTDEHWEALDREIGRISPSVVMLDSVTRLTLDSIEDSSVATRLMKQLREISHRHGIALILIHHTQKMDNRPITLASLAGSRVIGQEMDFMIGVNRLSNNVRYLKDVAYRYYPDDAEHVLKFQIDFNQIIQPLGTAYESDLIRDATATTAVNENDQILLNHFIEVTNGEAGVVIQTKDLYEKFINTGTMTRPTLHTALKRLENNGLILKPEKGSYILRTSNQ
jgi:RecA-family ATPase